ncbi:hypothetical protein IGI04_040073 [Brassica rapa subsp. trilocularis]|uniref:Uncharacterized protein n=1 Tax=Brassica rapa subsp. trilocularis TaxID=1813537 RepID=A0ABQ7KNE7_BRACM|nr:hypothetical protein IGI04_040073 [Brassica rapa subsp. trilocularis]
MRQFLMLLQGTMINDQMMLHHVTKCRHEAYLASRLMSWYGREVRRSLSFWLN